MKKGNTAIIWLIILVIVLGAGYSLYKNQQEKAMKAKEEKATMMKKEEEKKAMEKETMMKKEEEMMTMLMTDKTTKKGQLIDVTAGAGTGTAYVLRKDGKLSHFVSAKLPDPETGTFYEGWLVKKTPKLTFFSTGMMTKQKNGMYELTFSANNLYDGYDFVVITLEKVKDAIPEKHILEGTVR